jgi:hypothetical protein
MKILMIHLMLASVSLQIAFEVLLKMKARKMKAKQMGIFLLHILCIDYCCYLGAMDEQQFVTVEEAVGQQEHSNAIVGAAVVADALDDSDAGCDSSVGVANTSVAANAVVSAVGNN